MLNWALNRANMCGIRDMCLFSRMHFFSDMWKEKFHQYHDHHETTYILSTGQIRPVIMLNFTCIYISSYHIDRKVHMKLDNNFKIHPFFPSFFSLCKCRHRTLFQINHKILKFFEKFPVIRQWTSWITRLKQSAH